MDAIARGIQESWRSAAVQIYGNWLSEIAAAKQPAQPCAEAVR
jgi:hypothetical protein